MSNAPARALLTLLVGGVLCSAVHAERPRYGLVLDARQIAELQLSGAGDDVTYTEVSAGATAEVNNRRIVLSSAYRLSYRLPGLGDVERSFDHDGIARLRANVVDEWVTLDAGVIATRSRVDPAGAASQTNSARARNLTRTLSTYAQPGLNHRFGELELAAAYRYAYTKNEGRDVGAGASPFSNRFDDAVNQLFSVSAGMRPGDRPFGWSVTGLHNREDASALDKQSRSSSLIGEVTVPVAPTIALVASGGYEKTRITEGEALIDPLTGFPVRDKNGRFVVDPTQPRLLAYDMGGLTGDAGIVWKPSRRTRLEARAGYRYGGPTFTGLLEMRPSERTGLTVILTDRINSFSETLSDGLAEAPPILDLDLSIDPSSSYQNCLFGKTAGSGRCLGGALGQAAANSYRERALNIIYNRRARFWTFGASAGYFRRNYLDARGSIISLAGVVDHIYFGDLTMSGTLTRHSGVAFSLRGNVFRNGRIAESDVVSGAFETNYYRTFGRGLRMEAKLAVDVSKEDRIAADVRGRAELNLQYQF